MSNFMRNIHPLLKREHDEKKHDTNYAVLNAIHTMLEEAETETIQAKMQSSLETATDIYLDYWGDWFGVYRRTEDENDTIYRQRIIEALNIPRGTNNSIKEALRRFMDDRVLGVEVYEPWTDIFYLNKSKLNGEHHLQGDYYHFAIIDIYIGKPFDESLLQVINDFKPAGVLFYLTYAPSLGNADRLLLGGKYGTIDHTSLHPSDFDSTLDMFTPLEQPYKGNISLDQYKDLNSIFTINDSDLDSKDVLVGSYSVYNNLIHSIGYGNYTPKYEDDIRAMKQATENVPDEVYEEVSKIGETGYAVKLTPLNSLHLLYNIGEYMTYTHPPLERFEGEYEKVLANSSIVAYLEVGNGVQVNLQVFNIESNQWETIGSVLGTNHEVTLLAELPEQGFLNKNQYLYLRLYADREVEIVLNFIQLTYNNTLENKGVDLGFALEVRSEGTEVVTQ